MHVMNEIGISIDSFCYILRKDYGNNIYFNDYSEINIDILYITN